MSKQDQEKRIWELADKIRGRDVVSPENLIEACREEGVKLDLESLAYIIQRFGRGECYLPQAVAEFIANILKLHSPSSILDPWAELGFLAVPLHRILSPERCHAYLRNAIAGEIWDGLAEAEGISRKLGDGLALMQESDESYEAIACSPPLNMESRNPYSIEISGKSVKVKDTYDHLLMLEACRHLSPKGRAVFVTTTNFFTTSGRAGKARHTMASLGYRPIAAIELPAGTFSAHNLITHLVVIEKSEGDQLFVGRFSKNEKHQQTLLENLATRNQGASVELGCLTSIESFRGFTTIDLGQRVRETAKRNGLVGYPFADIVVELNTPKSSKGFTGFDEVANAVYLPQMATTNATTSQERLPEKLKSYLQLVLNPDVADAEFVAGMLNTPFGQTWRDSLRTGSTIPRISKSAIEASTIFLPPRKARDVQVKVVECQHQLARLRNEINELESQLWRKPAMVDQLEKDIQSINREDRYEDWLDSLPFPLASILWACHTDAGSLKEQYERKLHFFESLAQFLSVIFLSAFSSNEGLWTVHGKSLQDSLARNNLSLERATFGTWKAVVELFSKQVRSLLNSEPELVYELFKTRDRTVLESLASKAMVPVIQKTNKIRNDWAGHTGVVSERDAKSVNDQLSQHIQKVREIFGVTWTGYELLLPGTCRMRNGEFHFDAKRIMGTRTPFPTETVVVGEAMEDSHLYLKSPDESRGLKLLPLVKVMPSPRTEDNACYFYNRVQSNGIRFLSYYFEADAEVVDDFSDVGAALDGLKLGES